MTLGGVDPGEFTPWFVLVSSACLALTSVGGILFAIHVWWRNRGKGALKTWIHETSGSAQVAREVRDVKDALQSLETLRAKNHDENQRWLQRHDGELGAMVTAQDRLGTAVKALADEITAESEARTEALTSVLAIAQRADAHARSRRKHPVGARLA